MERDNLSKKQKIMYDFIADFIEEHGYSPTFREIASGLDYKSIATVATHINNLANGGWIIKTDKVGRSIEINTHSDTGENFDSISLLKNRIKLAWKNLSERKKIQAELLFEELDIQELLSDIENS